MTFLRHLEETSDPQALIVMGDFSHPTICCRDSTAGLGQLRRFLKCTDGSFLMQVVEELIREGALLDLILTKQEELYGDVKTRDGFGCSDNERVEFMVLRRGEKSQNRVTSFDFRRPTFSLFRDLLGRILWDALCRSGVKKS